MKINILIVLSISFMIGGCVTSKPPMYEYGNYSESFYAMKRTPGEKSDGKWKSSLESIIEKSNASAIRVPPGVFANLGYLYLKVNDTENAIKNFELEKKIYPEAEVFMNNLIKKAKAQG